MHMSSGDNVREIFGAFGYVWAKWGEGSDESPRSCFFLLAMRDDISQQLIFTKFGCNTWIYVPSTLNVSEGIFKHFLFGGHFPHKPQNWMGSNNAPYSDQPTARVRNFRCWSTFYSPRPESRSTFLYDVRFWIYGSPNFPNFRIIAHDPYKTPKKYLP